MVPFVSATGTMDFAQKVFIRVYTDAGFYGVGECSAFPMIVGETQDTCYLLAQHFAKIWKEKDPLQIEERMAELHLFIAKNTTIKSAFDMALYDIAAKNAALPLYKFLGGEKRPVETDMTIGIGTAEEMALKATEFVQNGCTILKVKLGKNVEDDVERIRQIRVAVGNHVLIRIDANQGWSVEGAKTALKSLEQYQIEFCEQPMPVFYDDYLPELVKQSPIKIMADESCFTHHDARKLINAKACNSINIKFAKSGGINEGLKIYREAEKANMPCMIGAMLESRIALSAKLHFAFACKNINYYDLDTCMLGHKADPCINGLSYKGYHLSLPDLPGIGSDADENFLKGCERAVV